MRGLTSTIALLLVLAGLGAYIYFVDSERPAGGIEEKAKVFTVEADKIQELTVTSAGEVTTLRKENGTWKITAPTAAEADATEVSNLTSAIASLEVNRVVDEKGGNLAEYGLAEPRIKVAFKAEGGAAGEVLFGEKTATQSDMYTVKAGEPRVFLVSAFQESSLAKKTFDLRDKRVLHVERDKVDSIELVQPGSPTIQLAREGSEWAIKQPIQSRGDYSGIEQLLTRLASASMTKLVDPNSPEDFGLDKPALVATLGAGSTRATLELGPDRGGTVYARDRSRPTPFGVDASLLTDAKKSVDDLRDKDLFEFRSFNALRFRVTSGPDTHEFAKVSGTGENPVDKWQRTTAGKTIDAETSRVDDLLSKLSALRAQSFTATAAAAAKAPPALIVAVSYDTDKFERVRYIRGDKQTFGTRDGEPGFAVLDQTAFDDTMKALAAALEPPAPTPPASPTTTPAKP